MNTGGYAQMSSNNFSTPNGFGNPAGGLASRRGGRNLKPLSFEAIKNGQNGENKENAVPTPRTSRSHLLAGLRTAPKSATATSFGPASPSTAGPTQQFARNNIGSNVHGVGQDNMYNAPKTAMPQYNTQTQTTYTNSVGQQYTVDQVLAPPELGIDDQAREHMDPGLYAQLVATNLYLAQQQQRLQQQLRAVQAAAQHYQQLNLNSPQLTRQQLELYQQQQQLRTMQHQLGMQAAMGQAQSQAQAQQFYYNPATGQYYVDTSAMTQIGSPYNEQPMTPGGYQFQQQQMQMQMQAQSQAQQQQFATPRVQVSPPLETQADNQFRSQSPPKRRESPPEVTPLPPPSANAFRRGHKKSGSLAINSALAAASLNDGAPMSAGPRTSAIPPTPMTGGYGPGQARAGEHPIRQPRGPPEFDELKQKPTTKHEGSKNFATRTRRSLVSNLVKAGLERRKGAGSSAGSMSPVSETAEDSTSPITDNDSDSGRSGSGSLAGEEECSSSRTSTSGSWGAIGSDRPGSRQKGRGSVDSSESVNSSFANVFKNGSLRGAVAQEATDGQRRAPRLVLTSAEKRKPSVA